MLYFLTGLISYLTGSIPWGYLIGKINGIDIRKHGSGNIGATNVNRILGKKWGVLCFLLDFLKGMLPVLAVQILLKQKIIAANPDIILFIAVFATVAGHIWMIFLKFKGGKGIATSAGALSALAPLAVVAAGVIWIIVFYSTRYVSVASIAAALVMPAGAYIFSKTGIAAVSKPILILLIVISLLAILKHRDNIKRLLNGTENKFEKKKKTEAKTCNEGTEAQSSKGTEGKS